MHNQTLMELDLVEVPESFYNYEVVTSDGETLPANRDIKHYRGAVANDPTSLVAISIWENEIAGIISTTAGDYNLGLNPQLGMHVLYNDKNLRVRKEFECNAERYEDFEDHDPDMLMADVSAANVTSRTIHFYYETQFDMYTTLSRSVRAVENYVVTLYNQVATVYQNENINAGLSQIYVWTIQDGYTSTDITTIIRQFRGTRTNFKGDLAQLLTFRKIGGGMAYVIGDLCRSDKAANVSVLEAERYYSNYPNYSFSVCGSAHEFGHTLGSDHTHDCVWNGNKTAIDGCGEVKGCANPGLPVGGGTIMSYCHNAKGSEINMRLGFGPQPGNVIRNTVNRATCLSHYIYGPRNICNQEVYEIYSIPAGASITWSASNSNLRLVSGQGTSRATFAKNATGNCNIIASINQGGVRYETQFTVWTGAPVITSISGKQNVGNSSSESYTANVGISSTSSFTWQVTPSTGVAIDNLGSTAIIRFPAGDKDYKIQVQATNDCGTSAIATLNVATGDNEICRMYPNPASGSFTIEMKESFLYTDYLAPSAIFYEVQLWSDKGLIKKIFATEKVIQVPIDGIAPGLYYVNILINGKTYQQKLIIK